MPEGDWESISREVVSLFSSLTDRPPVYVICLNWKLVCKEFEDDAGWTKWTSDGVNLTQLMEEPSASFIIFSSLGMHQMFYYTDKKPEIKHLLEPKEMGKFKLIKSRHDRVEIQIEREKDFILGKMKFLETHKLNFDADHWDYIQLRQEILAGKKLVLNLISSARSAKAQKLKGKVPRKEKPKTAHKIRSGIKPKPKPIYEQIQEQIRVKMKIAPTPSARKKAPKPEEILVDDYKESIKSAEGDIKALKNRENRKLANNALDKMESAADVIKRCERDITSRNKRYIKLQQQKKKIRKTPMKKLEKQTKLNELERKVEMLNRMTEKELKIKTQMVTEFCGLREAILTIRTNEEKLSPKDVNLLIDKAMLSETQTEDIEKTQKKLNHYKDD
jgi:hypothetical protein